MSIIRVTHPRVPFAQVPHIVTEDSELSWKAKGIFSYLIGRPPGWSINRTDLVRRSKDGQSGLQSGVKELQERGYLHITRLRDSGGKITGTEWELTFPGAADSPHMENPHMVDRPLYQEEVKQEGLEQENTCVLMWDMWKRITGLDTLKLTDNRKRRLKAVTRHLKPLAEEHDTTIARLWTLMVEAVWEDPWRREQRSRHDPVNVFKSAEQMETWVDKAVARLRVERGTERTSTETADLRASVDAVDLRRDVHHAALKEWWELRAPVEQDEVRVVRDQILARDFPGRSGTLPGIRKVCMVRAMEQVSGIEEEKEEVA